MDSGLYEFNSTILTITMLFSSSVMIVLGAYVYVNGQKNQVYRWFILNLVLLFLWNWSYMMGRYAPELLSLTIFHMMEAISVGFLGPAALGLARSYRGLNNRTSWVTRTAFAGGIIRAAYIATNPLHNRFFTELTLTSTEFGRVYYDSGVFIMICILGAVYYFVRGVKNPSVYWKKQLSNVGGSAIILVIAGFVDISGVIQLDISLPFLVLPFSLILLGIAVMKYQFMDILPYTLSESVNFIDDGFMVFSNDGSLEDYNKRFFDRITSVDACQNIDEVMKAFSQVMDNKVALNNLKYSLNVRKDNYISGELQLDIGQIHMHLQYITKAINDTTGMKIATIITFHDMSELQNLYEVLEERKSELMEARKKLEQHIETIQELTVETERNRLMAEVHDTLGHSMTEVLTLLEKCDMILGDDPPDILDGTKVIEAALKQSRSSLAEIRATVGRFRKMGVEL